MKAVKSVERGRCTSDAEATFNQAVQARKIRELSTTTYSCTEEPLKPISTVQCYGSKVQVKRDRRNLRDLSSSFPQVSIEVLTKLWENKEQSWNVCFDFLSSWLSNHGPQLLSMDQFEFTLSAEYWPSLVPTSSATIPQLSFRMSNIALSRSSRSVGGNSSGSDSWSFCEEMSVDDLENDDIASDVGDGWVQVGENSGPPQRSFRDVLLTPVSRSPLIECRVTNKRPRAWQPQIVCTGQATRRRCDVQYMDSATSLTAHTSDDDSDDESYDLLCGSKSFATAAMRNSLRFRVAVRQGGNQGVKVLRCKY